MDIISINMQKNDYEAVMGQRYSLSVKATVLGSIPIWENESCPRSGNRTEVDFRQSTSMKQYFKN